VSLPNGVARGDLVATNSTLLLRTQAGTVRSEDITNPVAPTDGTQIPAFSTDNVRLARPSIGTLVVAAGGSSSFAHVVAVDTLAADPLTWTASWTYYPEQDAGYIASIQAQGPPTLGPVAVNADGSRVYAVDTRNGAVISIDGATGTRISHVQDIGMVNATSIAELEPDIFVARADRIQRFGFADELAPVAMFSFVPAVAIDDLESDPANLRVLAFGPYFGGGVISTLEPGAGSSLTYIEDFKVFGAPVTAVLMTGGPVLVGFTQGTQAPYTLGVQLLNDDATLSDFANPATIGTFANPLGGLAVHPSAAVAYTGSGADTATPGDVLDMSTCFIGGGA
jgi:hypothetical protein